MPNSSVDANLGIELGPDPGTILPEVTRNKSIEAVYKYLLDQDEEEKETAVGWLMGICHIACRGLFIPDAHPEYLTVGADGVRAENNNVDRLRLFIQEWLLAYLHPFRELSADEVRKHADQF